MTADHRGRRMKWFFAVNQESLSVMRDHFEPLILAAVHSAKAHTTLDPHLVFDGGDDPFLDVLVGLGVKIIRHRVSFHDSLERFGEANPGYLRIAGGAFLRVEIPLIEIRDEFVLYSDCDVLFERDPTPYLPRPRYFACAPENDPNNWTDFNTGVMVMNLPALRRDIGDFASFISENVQIFNSVDQHAYQLFYRGRSDRLACEFNWKPYWGPSSDAYIVHFHGPKPNWVERLRADPEDRTIEVYHLLYHQNIAGYDHFMPRWQAALELASPAEGSPPALIRS